jgi:hypothetical protein
MILGAEFVGRPSAGNSGSASKSRAKKADDRSHNETGTAATAPSNGSDVIQTPKASSGTAAGERGAKPGRSGMAEETTAETAAAIAGPEETAKRIRALQKKLRQVLGICCTGYDIHIMIDNKCNARYNVHGLLH